MAVNKNQLLLKVQIPSGPIEGTHTKKFNIKSTAAEAVKLVVQSLPPAYRDVSFRLYSDGLPLASEEHLESYGFKAMDILVLKPINEADILERSKQQKESRRRLSQSNVIHQDFVKSGWLAKKKTSKRFPVNKRRWCVLKDNCIYYFRSPKDRDAMGHIDLDHSRVKFPQTGTKIDCTFYVDGPEGAYTLTAPSDQEAQSWYQGIVARTSDDNSDQAVRLRYAIHSGYVLLRTLALLSLRKWSLLTNRNYLYLFDSPADKEPISFFDLTSSRIDMSEAQHEMRLTTVSGTTSLFVETKSEFDEWKKNFESIVGDLSTREDVLGQGDVRRDGGAVIREGFLFKKKASRRFCIVNKKRYFLLKKNKLHYLANPLDTQAIGCFDLLHTAVTMYLCEDGRGKSYIQLVSAAGVHELSHEDDNELREWVDSIKAECVGVPFNVVHRAHVDFNYKWTGQNPDDIFEFKGKLGAGYLAYATVYKAIHRESGFELAIKIIEMQGSSMQSALEQEIDVLKTCRSPQIVSYYGTCIKGDLLWILMDYCAAGSIKDLMKTACETLSEEQLSYVCTETLKGLAYLHSINIIHHDIKAGNILCNEDGQVKLADFGVSKKHHDMLNLQANDLIGSPLYMSPEVIKKSRYNNKTDIWSLGITVVEMAEGMPPNAHITSFEALKKLPDLPPATLSDPKGWSTQLNDFIARCLVKEVDNRPDAFDLLMHPFLKELIATKVCMLPLLSCLKK